MAIEVNMEMVDRDIVDKYLKQHELKQGGTLKARVDRLVQFYVTEHSADLADCDCGGISKADLPECPFCGDAGEIEPATPSAAPATEPEPEAPPAPKPKAAKKAKKKTAAKKAAKPKAAKKAKSKKSKPKKAVKPKAAIEPTTPVEVVTADDLDREIGAFEQAAQDAANNVHEMGRILASIRDQGLWKLRANKDGVPRYKNFKQFVEREFKVSPSYAFDLIAIAERFSAEQVRKIGASKLSLVLRAPKDRQKEVEEAAASGQSREQIREGLRDMKGGSKTPPSGKVTVGLLLRQQVIPAMGRQKTVGVDPKPAKKVDDEPWCELDLENDVALLIKLVRDTDGSLSFVVEAKRAKSV